MRKLICLIAFSLMIGTTTLQAQDSYDTAIGLGLDFGEGSTFVGPSVKHFFDSNNAGLAEVTFANDVTSLTALYQYNDAFPNAGGLKWFAGAGFSIAFFDGGSDFFLRPTAGLDFKISNVPLSITFDWRPAIFLGDANGGDTFEPARFGLGFRYCLN
ncbi:hypothetical protein [Spongiivirga citrea]|uniref:Outer membrane beta-barrel protein n=1 Tax=Spongiivirga citrea TaxID=1481457 RepID=A0A6M0CEU8_9FLAO|nr:hypothetical protein [Spongiivirga citrea]NER16345.1 hypothetical protein [Spongiivirga citrea]